jgi:hypothetical protein
MLRIICYEQKTRYCKNCTIKEWEGERTILHEKVIYLSFLNADSY